MLKNVLGSDGSMHLENQIGNMRYNLTTGKTSYIIGNPNGTGIRTVMDENGTHLENQIGNIRQRLDGQGGNEIVF